MDPYISEHRLKLLEKYCSRYWNIHLGVADKFLLLEGTFSCNDWDFCYIIESNSKKFNFESKEINIFQEKIKIYEKECYLTWKKEYERLNSNPL